MKPSPVTVTKYIGGVPQTPTVHAPTQGGYILCVNDAGVSGYPDRVVRRSTSLATIVACWFDLGGEGGNAWVYHANGDVLSPAELAAAREQLGGNGMSALATYDAEGYDAQGYDAEGYDVFGVDRQGYDRTGRYTLED